MCVLALQGTEAKVCSSFSVKEEALIQLSFPDCELIATLYIPEILRKPSPGWRSSLDSHDHVASVKSGSLVICGLRGGMQHSANSAPSH